MRKAIYAGSFDPPQIGHEWVIRHAAELFDRLTVAIAVNPAKKATFSGEERREILESIVSDLHNVEICILPHDQLTVRLAEARGAKFILRGLRNAADFQYEQELAEANRRINPNILTVLVMTPPEFGIVSSSLVKSFVGFDRWENLMRPYVPEATLRKMREKFNV